MNTASWWRGKKGFSVSELKITNSDAEWSPKHYATIVGLFCAMYMINQAIVVKMFTIGSITTTAGIFTFPLCCIITDLLTEVYGFNRARRALWTVVACTFLFAFFTQLAIILPPASFWPDQEAFSKIFALGPRIALAGAAAWIIGELINSFIMSKMKIAQNAKGSAFRFIGSTVVGQFFDSLVFFSIAFIGTMPLTQLIITFLTAWALKIAYEIIALPFSVPAAQWLKKLEGIEHFDRQKITII